MTTRNLREHWISTPTQHLNRYRFAPRKFAAWMSISFISFR
jgi:hypothetical protein